MIGVRRSALFWQDSKVTGKMVEIMIIILNRRKALNVRSRLAYGYYSKTAS